MQETAVNQDNFKNFQLGFAEVSRFLLPFAVVWLLGAIGLISAELRHNVVLNTSILIRKYTQRLSKNPHVAG